MTALHLHRQVAPIGADGWEAIDDEARRILGLRLAARKLVPLTGPLGWRFAAVPTGDLTAIAPPSDGIQASLRRVQALVELRSSFSLKLEILEAISRGDRAPDLTPVRGAAERIAAAEDGAIFNGYEGASIQGITQSTRQEPIRVGRPEGWVDGVGQAVEQLRRNGIPGPFKLAVGPRAFGEIHTGREEGYPLRKQVLQLLGDTSLVESWALEHGVVMSVADGHYELTVGQDLAVGFSYQSREEVQLFIVETFTFRVLEPSAAVVLRRG
jgi:uncharacterized linocin/CFP29 family protein